LSYSLEFKESARLKGMADCYKIKLKNAGFRLVYQVDDSRVVVIVLAVGKRENLTVYKVALTAPARHFQIAVFQVRPACCAPFNKKHACKISI